MLSQAPKPIEPVEIQVTVWRGVDGLWRAAAKAYDMQTQTDGVESPDRAAQLATHRIYETALALGREEWFWQ